MPRAPFLTSKLQGFGSTIFAEMTALATETGSINLGQGFPDYDGPSEVLDAAVAAIRSGQNQYPPGPGVPVLRRAISEHQKRFWGLEYDPDREILVTAGATEALAGCLLGLLETGDEVALLEPMYDSYQACIALAGAVTRPVTLRPPLYSFDPDELRAAITPKTRVILLNSPHNPTGAVLDDEQLRTIADIAIANDLIVVSDEVYEHLTYDGLVHRSIAALPGMKERTLVISSGGKTFNTTGWKVGWVCGPAPLVAAARAAKQFLTYVSSGPFQPAIAAGLRLPDEYFSELARDLQTKRDRLMTGLAEAGFDVFKPAGTYFVTVDIRPIEPSGDGYAFCRSLPSRCGVVGIPNVVFYDRAHENEGRHLVRFAFCKRFELIDEAVTRLKGLS
ncbi:MAG: aminotransferase [Acidimicrobiales bacterium mtb01]|nr:pyridoxal phosphate-dependent aminotransferase [Actinomycetota bacterium]TEX48296.1 MAG: aminotransferase [Acidimicrobiales bacterium mtb01]